MSTEPTPPAVPDKAVDASLEAVARYWKGSRSPLQQYPSRPLTRVMLEAAAPIIASPRLSGAECDRLWQALGEHQHAIAAIRKALEFAVLWTRPEDHGEILAAAWEALKVLEGTEEEANRG